MQNTAMVKAIDDAIGAHAFWKLRLRSAIGSGNCEISSVTACSDDQCTFGKWLHGSEIDPQTKAETPYKVITRLHAEFHMVAGRVLASIEAGHIPEAQRILNGEYVEQSDKLMRALIKWKRVLT